MTDERCPTCGYPAERLDALLAAVTERCASHRLSSWDGVCNCTLCAALRAFREQVTA
jgi:hypothetical protein